MDDEIRGTEPGEGVRILGAVEAGPGSPRPVSGEGGRLPAPSTSWDDADEESWDQEWLAEDGDLDDPDATSAVGSNAPAARVEGADERGWGDGPRWRAEGDDWNDAHEGGDMADWAGDTQVGTLAADRGEESDLYRFDDLESVNTATNTSNTSNTGSPIAAAEGVAAPAAVEPGSTPLRFDDTISEPGASVASVGESSDDDAHDNAEPAGARGLSSATVPPANRPDGEAPGARRRPQPGDRTVGRSGARRPTVAYERTPSNGQRPPVSASSLGARVVTGFALLGVAGIVLAVFKQKGGVALVALALGISVFEFYTALRQRGFQPAILPGAFAAMLFPIVAYNRGTDGMVVLLVLGTLTTLLWYLVGVVRDRPAVNIAVTLSGVLYIGLLGGTAGLVLRHRPGLSASQDNHGLWILLGAVAATVTFDIAGYFIGANMGQRPVAPDISPNKTWEGLVGGVFFTFAVSFVIGNMLSIKPWNETSAWLALAAVVSVFAFLGDLTESMLKRDLGLKDMGTLLPGHGGILDRIDGMLFTIPAVMFLARWKNWI